MPPRQFCLTLVLVAAATAIACDDPAISTTRSGSSPTRIEDLTGRWAGTAIDSAGQVQMVWQVSQSGAAVTGSVTAATNVGRSVYAGSIAATVNSGVLTFKITVARGGIVDLPECSLELNGSSTELQQSSMAVTYTGTQSCSGSIQGGRLILIKQ